MLIEPCFQRTCTIRCVMWTIAIEFFMLRFNIKSSYLSDILAQNTNTTPLNLNTSTRCLLHVSTHISSCVHACMWPRSSKAESFGFTSASHSHDTGQQRIADPQCVLLHAIFIETVTVNSAASNKLEGRKLLNKTIRRLRLMTGKCLLYLVKLGIFTDRQSLHPDVTF